MKKNIFTMALIIITLLSACEKGNIDVNTNPNPNQNQPQNTSQNTNGQISIGEQFYGMIQAIDGMTITIDASQIVVFGATGEYHFNSGDEPIKEVKQATNIRLTEETIITVRTNQGGQIIGERSGTIDDMFLQAVVIADGQWQDGELIATAILVINH